MKPKDGWVHRSCASSGIREGQWRFVKAFHGAIIVQTASVRQATLEPRRILVRRDRGEGDEQLAVIIMRTVLAAVFSSSSRRHRSTPIRLNVG